jgi:hypothetical protein
MPRSRIQILNLNSGEVPQSVNLERLGFKRGTTAEWYKHYSKEVDGRVYQAWIEIIQRETISGRKEGWTITLGIQVNDAKLLEKLAERMNEILESLKAEGYKESV